MMKLRILLAFFTFFCGLNTSAQNKTYKQHFAEEYQEALTFLKKNKALIQQELSRNGGKLQELLPIVFPEIVRFSDIQNLIEAGSLELLYVNYGTSYANFSIGRFQMKPSFVETLENYVKQYKIADYTFITQYPDKEVKKIRKERVKRLNSLKWQLRYVNVFYQVVQRKYPNAWQNTEEKIRFLASAYNRGLSTSAQGIKTWAKQPAFPYGKKYKGTQYNYTDIAWNFYQNEIAKIF